MFQPLPLFIGLRYVRARQHRFFVSFITWVALAGLSLGVASLIVVLSVMNGFETELRTRLLSLSAHAHISLPGPAATAGDAGLERRLRAIPGVVGVAPCIELAALAVHEPDMLPLVLRGIDPVAEESVAPLRSLLTAGDVGALVAGSEALIIGSAVAEQLGVRVGDQVRLLVPVVTADSRVEPVLREFSRCRHLRGGPGRSRQHAGARASRRPARAGAGGRGRDAAAPALPGRAAGAGRNGGGARRDACRGKRRATGPRITPVTSARSASRRR